MFFPVFSKKCSFDLNYSIKGEKILELEVCYFNALYGAACVISSDVLSTLGNDRFTTIPGALNNIV